MNNNDIADMASKKLGLSTEEIGKAVEAGNTADLVAKLSPADKARLITLLKDKATVERLKQNPMFVQVLKAMSGK
ncbi:MAG: hypothetical protein LBN40_02080 [Oscillospiraceae bacterium]|jgi:DNA recombination-dependent growth factor C|nr:hypothetical protein [Oscillospiraceae bacterium]